MPSVSVVVPTYNRMDTLPEVLDAVLGQSALDGLAGDRELIVVDDGSAADTAAFLASWPATCNRRSWRVQALHQDNQGPAAARNHGVQAASGELVAFLGDDTVPSTGWLARHLGARQRGLQLGLAPESIGVIGYTRWHPRMRLNPFLHYINEYGLQFGYALIDDPDQVPFNFFYTSNLLVPRQALLDEPFDTDFPYAAWEDIEVSYRLQKRGFRLLYEPRATVEHDHPTDLGRFAQRQEKAGYCGVVFWRKHPEMGGFLGLGDGGPPAPAEGSEQERRWRLAQNLQKMLQWQVVGWPLFGWIRRPPAFLTNLWEETLRFHYIQGLNRGWRDLCQESRSAKAGGES